MNQMMSTFQRMSSVSPNPFNASAGDSNTATLNSELTKYKEKAKVLKEKNQELMQTNSNISAQIVSMQEKQQQLEKTIETYKKYRWMLHHAAGIQCL